jgi:hypothetical protein
VVAVGGTSAALLVSGGGGGSASDTAGGVANRTPARASFAQLSKANSNRCDLDAAELRTMPASMHLQGACCFPMDQAHYRQQLHDLGRYRALEKVIPHDPYDVSVRLADRLLSYRSLPLSRREQAAYAAASRRSGTGGPCCCRCWRWQALRGQAHYLLHRRSFSAARLARVWDAEEGCGGPSESA